MLRRRAYLEIEREKTRKNLAVERDEGRGGGEKRKKMEHRWEEEFFIFDGWFKWVYLLSSRPFSFLSFSPLSFLSVSSLFTSISSNYRTDIEYVQVNILTITNVNWCRSRTHCQHRRKNKVLFCEPRGWPHTRSNLYLTGGWLLQSQSGFSFHKAGISNYAWLYLWYKETVGIRTIARF